MVSLRNVAFLATLFGIFTISYGQELDKSSATVTVEASRITGDEIDESRTVTIIDRETIQKKKATTVIDVLRDVPGVVVSRQGSLGQVTTVFIRGSKSEDTLVLVDGIEINDLTAPGGGFDFSTLSPNQVERIEVYRGPQSVRFGSGALGGVINIITKEGAGPLNAHYFFEAGSFNSTRSAIGFNAKPGELSYSFGVDEVRTDGYSAASEKYGASEDDGAVANSASAKIVWQPKSVSRVEMISRYSKADFDLDRGGGASDDPNYTGSSEQILVGLSGTDRLFSENLKSNLSFSYWQIERRLKNAADSLAVDTADAVYDGNRWKADMEHELAMGDAHTLRFGLHWKEENAKIRSLFTDQWGTYPGDVPKQSQSILGEALTYVYDNGVSFGDLGIRFDQTDEQGSKTSSRVSLGRRFREERLEIALVAGTGFKIPTLYQLYEPTYGNTDLKIENSKSLEFVVEKQFTSRDQTLFTAFAHNFEDMIDFSNSRYRNVDEAKTRGFEFESRIQVVDSFRFSPSYTYLEATEEPSGDRLLRRPRKSWGVQLDYFRESWTVYMNYQYRGERIDSDPTTFSRVRVDSHDVVNLGVEYRLKNKFRIHGRVENIFDENYEEVLGYGTPGASAYFGFGGEF